METQIVKGNETYKVTTLDGVAISSHKVYEDFFISISHRHNKSAGGNQISSIISFEYVCPNGKEVIDFETRNGPIGILRKSDDESKNTSFHHLLGKYSRENSSWTQTSVEESGLKDAVIRNDLEEVYSILKSFSGKMTSIEIVISMLKGE